MNAPTSSTLEPVPNRKPRLSLKRKPSPVPSSHAIPDQDTLDLYRRVLHQVENGLDRSRLLPRFAKRQKDLHKKLDRPLSNNRYYGYTREMVEKQRTSTPVQSRAAEKALVEAIAMWHDECAELAPERLEDLYRLIHAGFTEAPPIGDLASLSEKED